MSAKRATVTVCLLAFAACTKPGDGESPAHPKAAEGVGSEVFWSLDWQQAKPLEIGDNYDPNGILDDFVYGAVYFRRSNPPPEDWARDYRTAEEDGHNIFRHWFLWGAIEQSPGEYDFSEYDPHFDLAAKHGIKVIIGEMLTSAPEWAFARWPEARLEHRDGTRDHSGMNAASVSGGYPGLSLNHPEVRAAAGQFLEAMAAHYRDHPAMAGWDLANEMKFPQTPNESQADYDFSPATQAKFRTWLEHKYGDLETLRRKWNRLGYTDWNQVEAPRHNGPYPDVLDWLEFRVDDFHEQVQWRANVIRSVDPDHPVTAHAKAYALSRRGISTNDAFAGAPITELYGFTWAATGQGFDAWKHLHAVDLIRAAADGKDFWHAEATGGPRWTSGQPRDNGKVTSVAQLRMQNLLSFAGGAQGLLNPRWRPLLNGPLWGAYGFYGLDGSRTDRSAMASRIAKWGRRMQAEGLWAADPVQGDIGIVFAPESQTYLYAYGNTGFTQNTYHESAYGAYRAFFDNNIQADWVPLTHIDRYDVLYLPAPLMLDTPTVETLIRWVEDGGTLISEGAPGYVAELGLVGETQPHRGLDTLFGVTERYVEFGRDIHEGMTFTVDAANFWVGFAHQEYEATTGTVAGRFGNGRAAVVDHRYGEGRTRLIGAFPGYAYHHTLDPALRNWYAGLADWSGIQRKVEVAGPSEQVVVRVHAGEEAVFLWLVNHDPEATHAVHIKLASSFGEFGKAEVLWGDSPVRLVDGRTLSASVPSQDALVIRLTQ